MSAMNLPAERACHEDGWLVLEAVFEGIPAIAIPSDQLAVVLLTWNALLVAGAKFVFSAATGRSCARSELPWFGHPLPLQTSGRGAAGVVQAEELWRSPKSGVTVLPLPKPLVLVAEFQQACEESGWPIVKRSPDTLVADLEVNGGSWQATFLPGESETLVVAEVCSMHAIPADCRHAIARLLLLAGDVLRWVRPALRMSHDECVAVFEVWLPPVPDRGQIADALCALSIACRLCGPEARSLTVAPIARDYLEVLARAEQQTSILQPQEKEKEKNHGSGSSQN